MSIRLPKDNNDIIIDLGGVNHADHLSQKLTQGSHGRPSWSPEIEAGILEYFYSLERPYRTEINPPFPEPLRSELIRFLISLDGYYESRNPVIPVEYLFNGVASGPSFATTLKRVRLRSILCSFNASTLEFNEDLKDVPYYLFQDIGDIFNYNYLVNWEQPDDKDYLKGFIPLTYCQETASKLRDEMKKMLLTITEPQEIDSDEILYNITGSKSMDQNYKKDRNWDIKGRTRNLFNDKIGPCKRTVLQVGPANVRDTVILTTNSLNTVKLIEQQTQRILEKFDESLQIRDPGQIERKLNRLKKFEHFLMRDIEKEGITKPRYLLKMAIEALNERFPNMRAYQGTSEFYEDFSIILDNEEITPIRGHGLGMANALTTFIQIAIYKLVIEESDNENYQYEGDNLALTLNDDFVIGFESEEDYEAYDYAEDIIFPKLGVIRSKKKSFSCRQSYVIAERYYNYQYDFDKKESYTRREVLNCLGCSNIVQAKQLISSTVSMKNIHLAKEYLEEIISYWGYEFFPEEINYPSMLGGWFSLNLEGVCLDLLDLDKLPYNNKIYRAYEACKFNSVKIRRRNNTPYVSPIIKALKPTGFPDKYNDLLNLGTYGDIYSKFFRVSESSGVENLWDKLFDLRQRTFKKNREYMSYDEFLVKIVEDYPTKTFYPNRDMTETYIHGYWKSGYLQDIYLSDNPIKSMLAKYDPDIRYNDIKEDFSINFSKKDSISRSMNSDIRKRLKGSVFNIGREDFYLPLAIGIFDSDNIDKLYDSFLNPQAVARVASSMEGMRVPILKKEFRTPLIESKREVFKRFLKPDEHLLLQRYKRTLIRDIIRVSDTHNIPPEDILEDLNEIYKDVPESEEDIPEEEIIPTEEIESDIANNITLEDFWTWRTDTYQICEPYNRIFASANHAITMDSFGRGYVAENHQRPEFLDENDTMSLSDAQIIQKMLDHSCKDYEEALLAAQLYSKWSKQDCFQDLGEDENFFQDIFGE